MNLHGIAQRIVSKSRNQSKTCLRITPLNKSKILLTVKDSEDIQILQYTYHIKNNIEEDLYVDPNLFYSVAETANRMEMIDNELVATVAGAKIVIVKTDHKIKLLNTDKAHLRAYNVNRFLTKLRIAKRFVAKNKNSVLEEVLIDNETRSMVSTNGSILCRQTIPNISYLKNRQVVIRANTLNNFYNIKGDLDETKVGFCDKYIYFTGIYTKDKNVEFSYASKLPSSQVYPIYRKILSQHIIYKTELLLSELKKGMALIKNIKSDCMVIDFENLIMMDSNEVVKLCFTSDLILKDAKFKFNTKYMRAVLGAFGNTKKVFFNFTKNNQLFIVNSSDIDVVISSTN